MTPGQFARIFPKLALHVQDRYWRAITLAMAEFEVTTLVRQAAFIAQVGHETGGLKWMQEIGGPKYFAKYDGRVDLGNTQPGDGARYHGRGLIQLTGRANYREFGQALGLPLEDDPDQAAEVEVGARIACRFWKTRGCNELADHGRFEQITRKINGGLRGLDDRMLRWKDALETLGV